ncbi:MAG: tyrosine-type recombinase/integrase [Bacteroidales bacterium]|nr:tyrosine-type recombinase/integrase [Bacteroidales bacterium]
MRNKFLAYIRDVRRYSERTCSIYSEVLDEFVRFCEGTEDFSVVMNVNAIRAYEVYLMDTRKLSSRTVSQHLSVLSSFCRFLIKQGVIQSNPVHLVKRPKVEKRLPLFYKDQSMEAYFEGTKGDPEFGTLEQKLHRLIISMLASCGLRRAELISLNVGSVDFGRSVLRVTGKGDKMREIPLIPSLCEEISLYLKAVSSLTDDAYEPSAPLLRTPKGARLYPVYVDRVVKNELAAVPGITVRRSPHVLRHTLATELLSEGTDLNSIKELLGHSSLAATQVYTHNTVERLQSVYKNAHPRAKNGGKNGD